MKKNLHLTPVSSLPPITPEDHNFALMVKKEYNLPFNELCWLIRDVRDTLQEGFSELKESVNDDYEKKYYKGLRTVNLKSDDPLFNTFNNHLKKIKIAIRIEKDSAEKFINKIKYESAFLKIVIYFHQTDLIKISKHVVVGMFLTHFKLYKGKPYKTKAEWKDKPTQDDNWENYLFGRVKTRIKKYSSEISL
jgi:hypothetical protein